MYELPEDRLLPLLQRYRVQGDEEAFARLIHQTRGRLLSIARRIGRSQDAEDCVQSAYHSLLRREHFPADVPVRAWLTTAVVRLAYRRKATERRQMEIARRLSPADGSTDPVGESARAERDLLLRRAVDALPSLYRDPLVLHHLQGLTTPEVAQLLEVPEPTVRSRLQRGRRLLQSRLDPRLQHILCLPGWLLIDAGRGLRRLTAVTARPGLAGVPVALALLALVAVLAALPFFLAAPPRPGLRPDIDEPAVVPVQVAREEQLATTAPVVAPRPGVPPAGAADELEIEVQGSGPAAVAAPGPGTVSTHGQDAGDRGIALATEVAEGAVPGGPPEPEPALSISGWVRYPGGEPVDGASVRVLAAPGDPDAAPESVLRTSSLPDGSFTLGGLSPGLHRLSATHPDCLGSARTRVQAGDREVELFLAPAATLEGLVVDPGGEPVDRGLVCILQAMSSGSSWARSLGVQRDGTFLMRRVSPGRLTLQARHPDFQTSLPRVLELSPGQVVRGLVLTLREGHTISGRVTDQRGTPLEGVLVRAQQGDLYLFSDSMRAATGPEGRFVVGGLEPGESYELVPTRRGYYLAAGGNRYRAGTQDVTLVMHAGGIVRGRVTGPGGQPEAGAMVKAELESSPMPSIDRHEKRSAETTEDGSYELAGLPPGRWWVLCAASGELPVGKQLIDLRPGQELDGIDFTLVEGCEIAGRVLDAQDRPVPGIRVDCRQVAPEPQGPGAMPRAETDAAGAFRLARLSPALYQLEPHAEGLTLLSDPRSLQVRCGASVLIRVARLGSIRGQVMDATGSPVTELRVRALADTPDPETGKPWTSLALWSRFLTRDGRFELQLTQQCSGPGRLLILAPDQAPLSLQLAGLDSRGELDVGVLVLSPGSTITGRVLGPDGLPVTQARVWIPLTGGAERFTTTDSQGSFTLTGLPPGEGSLHVYHRAWVSAIEIVDLPEGGPLEGLVIHLQPEGAPPPPSPPGTGTGVQKGR